MLNKGTKVRVKRTYIGKSVGIKPHALNGGEGIIIDFLSESPQVYRVELKNGKFRTARRKELVVHRRQ